VTFVGPRREILELFGDKVRARHAALEAGLPVLAGSDRPVTVDEAFAFLEGLGPGRAMMLKAVAGGGGRGMRVVRDLESVAAAFERGASEAAAAFGDPSLFAEELMTGCRHIEVQILGDGSGSVTHLGERDCSVQRRHQKVIEVAPAPSLAPELRQGILDAAVRLAGSLRYDNVGTVEFLVGDGRFAFIEANPRIQVEHTVTEEITGCDLVAAQLRLSAGEPLAALALEPPAGAEDTSVWAIQLRVTTESVQPDGTTLPAAGTVSVYEMPTGHGIRIDGAGYAGYRLKPSYDSLLAKIVVRQRGGGFGAVVAKADRALSECRVEGVATNIAFLHEILRAPSFRAGAFTTTSVDQLYGDGRPVGTDLPRRYFTAAAPETVARPMEPGAPHGTIGVSAPMAGSVVTVMVAPGELVRAGQLVAVLEAMKLEHEVRADTSGHVADVLIEPGTVVHAGQPLLYLMPSGDSATDAAEAEDADLDALREDLAEVIDRHAVTLDAARPEAVARRRATGQRTARENVADLVDPGTFVEYGPLAIAAQRRRRTVDELIARSPADGMVAGVGQVNGAVFGDPASRCTVLAYDYTVFAGTQGLRNHAKADRLIEVAEHGRLPLVLFGEGGGGRPGEDGGDYGDTFAIFAKLSGLVPMVAIVSGRCYAGNASLVGCCDVIIATRNSNIGMGGPAMIEGGGLGVYRPEEIGPIGVQSANGVVDLVVEDEAEAVRVAKQYLSYFQGRLPTWEAHDQREMRRIVPENRLRAYDVRRVLHTLADVGSVLELRAGFGHGIITALARVEGRPLGIVANNPSHLGGAIDSDAADKAARFMQLCDAFDLPMLSLVDTPGIMVGPDVETTALVRHSSRLFLAGANLRVPRFAILLRKVYGLGGIAMTGGSFKVNTFTVAWPTGEFGAMGLEGAVRLAYRTEMDAIQDRHERRRFFDQQVAAAYRKGKAVRLANAFAVDDTIDPAESRFWLANMMASLRPPAPRNEKKRTAVDAW
jgi:acetyl-CoA carboxylase carboxyltransferase component/acetyl/propionyl-CoA carboxylase alpha subunit